MPASDGSHLSEIRFRPRRIFTKDDASFNILTDRSSRPKPQEAGQQQQCSVTHLPSIGNGEARRRAPLERERERERAPSFLPSLGTQCNIVVVVAAAAATCGNSGDGPKIVENARARPRRREGTRARGAWSAVAPTCDCLLWASLPPAVVGLVRCRSFATP